VNLIGKGYPAPRPGFRWCTETTEDQATSQFIEQTANSMARRYFWLGARKAESAVRSGKPNATRNCLKEGPDGAPAVVIPSLYRSGLSNDDVWMFLTRCPSVGAFQQDLMHSTAERRRTTSALVVVRYLDAQCA